MSDNSFSDGGAVERAGEPAPEQGVVATPESVNPEAPQDVLLVLDAPTGQNALSQVEVFRETATVPGLILTKLDGTARGGVVVAVHEAIDVPVKFLGNGEQAEDLEVFDAGDFATELVEA